MRPPTAHCELIFSCRNTEARVGHAAMHIGPVIVAEHAYNDVPGPHANLVIAARLAAAKPARPPVSNSPVTAVRGSVISSQHFPAATDHSRCRPRCSNRSSWQLVQRPAEEPWLTRLDPAIHRQATADPAVKDGRGGNQSKRTRKFPVRQTIATVPSGNAVAGRSTLTRKRNRASFSEIRVFWRKCTLKGRNRRAQIGPILPARFRIRRPTNPRGRIRPCRK